MRGHSGAATPGCGHTIPGRVRIRESPVARCRSDRRCEGARAIQRSRAASGSADDANPAAPGRPCSEPTRYRSSRPTRARAPCRCSRATCSCQTTCSVVPETRRSGSPRIRPVYGGTIRAGRTGPKPRCRFPCRQARRKHDPARALTGAKRRRASAWQRMAPGIESTEIRARTLRERRPVQPSSCRNNQSIVEERRTPTLTPQALRLRKARPNRLRITSAASLLGQGRRQPAISFEACSASPRRKCVGPCQVRGRGPMPDRQTRDVRLRRLAGRRQTPARRNYPPPATSRGHRP